MGPILTAIISYLVQFLVAVAASFVAALILPKPKQPRTATRDLENPVAEAGKPVPRVWGTVTVRGLNTVWYGEKSAREYTIEV